MAVPPTNVEPPLFTTVPMAVPFHGGGIQLGGAHALGPRDNVGLPEIAFDSPTTLAFTHIGDDVGGMFGVVDGTHVARLGVLTNYMAAGSVAAGTVTLGASLPRRPS